MKKKDDRIQKTNSFAYLCSLAIYWPFRPFLIPNTPGYIQFLCEIAILSDFHMLFGALDAIGSKICVVTSLTDWLGPFTMLIRESFLQTTSSFVLVGARACLMLLGRL